MCLSVFFSLHDRTKLDAVDRIAKSFRYRPRDLDVVLVHKYGYELRSVCMNQLVTRCDEVYERRSVCVNQSVTRCDEVYDLAVRLCLFFSIHRLAMLENTALVAQSFVCDQDELNEALMIHYGCDLRF